MVATPQEKQAAPLRVLVATNVYPPRFVGGAELMAHELALAMDGRGHDLRVFAGDLGGPLERGERFDETLDGLLVHRVGLDPIDFDPARQNLVHSKVDQHLAAVLDDFCPDVVHAHNLMGLSIRLPVISGERGIPTVATLHDFWGMCLRNTLLRPDGTICADINACRECLPVNDASTAFNLPMRLRKDTISLSLARVAAFVSPSQFLSDRYGLWGLPSERLHVIPNGIGTSDRVLVHRDVNASDLIRIVYVGYLGTHKGVGDLVEAVAAMRNQFRVSLAFVGVGPLEDALRERITSSGLSDVVFMGRVAPDRMPEVYARADILVLPSRWPENQPVSIMEAMSMGLTVVASRIGGIPEIINDGVTGRLYDPGDTAMLAGLLDELVCDPRQRKALGANAVARSRTWSFADQAEALEALFYKVVADGVLQDRSLPIVGILGDCGALSSTVEASPGERLSGSLLIPAAWLTPSQVKQSAAVIYNLNAAKEKSIMVWVLNAALRMLWPILSAPRRVELIAKAQRLWPNFPIQLS